MISSEWRPRRPPVDGHVKCGRTRKAAQSYASRLFSHAKVLDMCAAPGSKTQQLLEALHSGRGDEGTPLPLGFVVANDADHKRCNLLTHQTKRVCSPCLLVTNHAGEQFPEVKRTGPEGQVGPSGRESSSAWDLRDSEGELRSGIYFPISL